MDMVEASHFGHNSWNVHLQISWLVLRMASNYGCEVP